MECMGVGRSVSKGVELRGVSKTIKGNRVLDNVSASFPKGRITGIRGHNGSGKTMLLRAIAGLLAIDEGTITVLGERITGRDLFPAHIGFVIEPLELWDEFTGIEMLELLAAIEGQVDSRCLQDALSRVGLNPNDDRRIKSYSFGMRQRLNIAQALVGKPRLLLLDEPTNALDEEGREAVRRIMHEERLRGTTIVVVFHDLEELNGISDVQFVMNDGRIKEA